jgi:hypothetical protein
VYLRETKRKNKDGTTAHYLQLAHNHRDPDSGVVKATILHSFGRAEHIERDALERLIASIARYLGQDPPLAATGGSAGVAGAAGVPVGPLEPVDARNLGGAWVLDRVWSRLGIDTAIAKVARGRRFDAELVERVLFALVAGRALAPSSKLEATRWIREEVHIDRLAEVDSETCYRTMDFLLETLPELQQTVFFAAADLLQMSVDIIFFDTTSTYFEVEFEDGELADDPDTDPDTDTDAEDGDGEGEDVQRLRLRGHSKDSRPDLPQIIIGMAVTRGGLPVRLWVWPGDTGDQTVLAEVKKDLAGWELNRTVWVVDAGFTSADNREVLTRGGSGFIVAQKLRSAEVEVVAARGRQGRFRRVDEQLEVKDVLIGEGTNVQRFVMMRNHQAAARDAAVRARMVELLEARIAGSDQLDADKRAELRGRIREKPGLWRYLRVTDRGLLRIDRTKIAQQAKLDGKTLLRTSDLTLDAADIARGYKALQDVERGFRDLKQLDLRPVFHRKQDRIIAHVQLCWLALLLIRTIELSVADTWRNIAHELDRIRLITWQTDSGTVSQRTRLTGRQHEILTALGLPHPPRFYQFDPTSD